MIQKGSHKSMLTEKKPMLVSMFKTSSVPRISRVLLTDLTISRKISMAHTLENHSELGIREVMIGQRKRRVATCNSELPAKGWTVQKK